MTPTIVLREQAYLAAGLARRAHHHQHRVESDS